MVLLIDTGYLCQMIVLADIATCKKKMVSFCYYYMRNQIKNNKSSLFFRL